MQRAFEAHQVLPASQEKGERFRRSVSLQHPVDFVTSQQQVNWQHFEYTWRPISAFCLPSQSERAVFLVFTTLGLENLQHCQPHPARTRPLVSIGFHAFKCILDHTKVCIKYLQRLGAPPGTGLTHGKRVASESSKLGILRDVTVEELLVASKHLAHERRKSEIQTP